MIRIFNLRNLILFIGGITLTIVYNIFCGNLFKPLMFTSIVMLFSVTYDLIFPPDDADKVTAKLKEVDSLKKEIDNKIRTIKMKSKSNKSYLFTYKYLQEINNLGEQVSTYYSEFKNTTIFIGNKIEILIRDIDNINNMLENCNEKEKDTYLKILNEKMELKQELESMIAIANQRKILLQHIMSSLEKMEAVIESNKLNSDIGNDICDLSSNLSGFTNDLKSVSKSINVKL